MARTDRSYRKFVNLKDLPSDPLVVDEKDDISIYFKSYQDELTHVVCITVNADGFGCDPIVQENYFVAVKALEAWLIDEKPEMDPGTTEEFKDSYRPKHKGIRMAKLQ